MVIASAKVLIKNDFPVAANPEMRMVGASASISTFTAFILPLFLDNFLLILDGLHNHIQVVALNFVQLLKVFSILLFVVLLSVGFLPTAEVKAMRCWKWNR